MKFFPALTLLFIALKLLGFIDWSWFWVLSPVWILILLAVFISWGQAMIDRRW